MDAGQGDTTHTLIEAARQCGHRITPVMLKKWHLIGLLPRPLQRPLGRGRGTVTIYPTGTTPQLLRLLEMRAEGGRFSPERSLWRLWWEGWPIDQDVIRTRLESTLETESVLEEWNNGKLPPVLAKLQKRVGSMGVDELFDLGQRLYTGGAVGDWRMKSVLPVFYRAGGIDGLRRSVPQSEMPDLDQTNAAVIPIAESIRRLGAATSRTALRNAIAGNPDIERARNDLHVIVARTTAVWSVVASLFPNSNVIRDLIAHYERHAWEALPYAVVYSIAFRQVPAYAALFDELSKHPDIATELRHAIDTEDSTNSRKPPRRLAPSGGTTHGEETSTCTTSLASPYPPPSPDTVSSP